ncbi:LuxR family transcriptional regulator [Vibrio lentus]|uniref:LuxR family transcriptional regulator n=1 Tax=Vibrio lentus TaxID=136468 RepID=UPI0007EEBD02|nr:LuxR family transcriptional regulator [Vibrio lentus]OBT27864.1 LuxR family transcriptional regulator [Vibrio tasmaniensis]PMI41061.1 LuxR family transcriptional regulator [Vibrio lentus]PMJ52810.1 LuxR family transcriptional regulator [Vibrio lentus]
MNMFNVSESLFLGLLISLSFPAFSSEVKPIGELVGIKHVPEVGAKYRIDETSYGAAPVTLSCELEGRFRTFSACELDANVRSLFLDMTKDNFTGRNVSGRIIEFTGIKHGQLFFELMD